VQNRRSFLTTGFSMAAAGLTGAAALTGARRSLATEAPPETTSLRLGQWSASCPAPLYIVDDLLREEGFTEVRYVPNPGPLGHAPVEPSQTLKVVVHRVGVRSLFRAPRLGRDEVRV
jgi:NitT/TauT family transport system substrate-binding protein